MKGWHLSVLVVASLMVAIAHCFPRTINDDDSSGKSNEDSIEGLVGFPGRSPFPLSHSVIRLPELPGFDDDDSDSLEGWNPFGTRFNLWRGSSLQSFFDDMQNFTQRIQEKMATIMSGLMEPGTFGLGGKIPEGGNTTSTTKIIDGHVVTVNQTTYQSSDNNSNVVFRVHVVDVKPVNQSTSNGDSVEASVEVDSEDIETLTTQNSNNNTGGKDTAVTNNAGQTTEAPRSVETVEDTAGNEIPMKNQIDNFNA